jgi:hypothetical protein
MIKFIKKFLIGRFYDKTIDSYAGCVKDVVDGYAVFLKDDEIRKKVVTLIVDNEDAVSKLIAQIDGIKDSIKEIVTEETNVANFGVIKGRTADLMGVMVKNIETSGAEFQKTVNESYTETMKIVDAEEAEAGK